MGCSKEALIETIQQKAKTLRKHAIQMTFEAGNEGGHISPALSMMDIIATLYFGVMRIDPKNSAWKDRDRFILSKGHSVLAYYPTLAEAGFFPMEELSSFEKTDSWFSGHPCAKHVPGIDCSSGSMGHGLSVGLGMALAGKIDHKDYDTYVMLGDGELNEGSVWEAVMAAKQYQADHLVAIVDNNGIQHDSYCKEVMDLEPLGEKWRSFGWHITEADGHDVGQLLDAFDPQKRQHGVPHVVIAKTVKGKGVSFMENKVNFHHARLQQKQRDQAIHDIEWGMNGE